MGKVKVVALVIVGTVVGHQFPMGKVKSAQSIGEPIIVEVSIPYGKGKGEKIGKGIDDYL